MSGGVGVRYGVREGRTTGGVSDIGESRLMSASPSPLWLHAGVTDAGGVAGVGGATDTVGAADAAGVKSMSGGGGGGG